MSWVIKELESFHNEALGNSLPSVLVGYLSEFLLRSVLKGSDISKGALISRDPNVLLLKNFLFTNPPLHIRRTLDQFHYYMTDDTETRDVDQVLSRYFISKYPGKPVPIMMVDQLWLWIVDNSK
jgi:hypothetical protein